MNVMNVKKLIDLVKADEAFCKTPEIVDEHLGDLEGRQAYFAAQALYSKYCLNLSAEKTARLLRDGLGMTAGEIAKIFFSKNKGLDLSVKEVAEALYASDGLDLSAAQVAEVFYNDLEFNLSDVAHVLYDYEEGLNLSAEKTAKALIDAGIEPQYVVQTMYRDLKLSLLQIAKALYSEYGANLYLEEIVDALDHDDIDIDLPIEQIADILHDIGVSGEEVTRILAERYTSETVARALMGSKFCWWDVPYLLHNDALYSYAEIAHALKEGADLSIEDIARALYSTGLSVDEVASALQDGLGMSDEETASALRELSDEEIT